MCVEKYDKYVKKEHAKWEYWDNIFGMTEENLKNIQDEDDKKTAIFFHTVCGVLWYNEIIQKKNSWGYWAKLFENMNEKEIRGAWAEVSTIVQSEKGLNQDSKNLWPKGTHAIRLQVSYEKYKNAKRQHEQEKLQECGER